MGVRRFNYTDRKRILHSHSVVSLSRNGDEVSFDAQLLLQEYGLPGTAVVVVEAYRQTNLRRYPFGTAASPRPQGPTSLTGFSDVETLLFRVKVVDPSSGLLLAEADRIRPTDPDGGERPSFLGVRGDNLSGEAWKLEFDNDHPVLVIEKQYGPYQILLASPHFRWLVLPHVFRSLLHRALADELEDFDDASADSWQHAVVRQAVTLTGSIPPEGDDEERREEWITDAVRTFCRRHGLPQKHHADVFPGSEP